MSNVIHKRLDARIKQWQEDIGDNVSAKVKRLPNGNGIRNMAYHRPGSQKGPRKKAR